MVSFLLLILEEEMAYEVLHGAAPIQLRLMLVVIMTISEIMVTGLKIQLLKISGKIQWDGDFK